MPRDLRPPNRASEFPGSLGPGRPAIALLITAAMAGIARWQWDANYQADEGAMIGQVPALLLATGLVVAIVSRVGRSPLGLPATAVLVVAAACLTLLVGGLGDGFVGLRPSAFILGVVISALGAAIGAAITALVQAGTRQ